ncbi:MAG TPA: tetratricopeptide repeat protein [Terriglobales bacterium]|nr:tetratricopeptide repeat protein [Terriglobales bacterium]
MLRDWLGQERLNWSGTPGELASALKVSVPELLSLIENSGPALERLGVQAMVRTQKSGMRQVVLSRSDARASAAASAPGPASKTIQPPAASREMASATVVDPRSVVVRPPAEEVARRPATAPAAPGASPVTAANTPAPVAASTAAANTASVATIAAPDTTAALTAAPRSSAAAAPAVDYGRLMGSAPDPAGAESARRMRLFGASAAAALLGAVALLWLFAGSNGPRGLVQSEQAVQTGDVGANNPALLEAAKAGDTSAQYTLAMKYLRGNGGDIDRTAAAEWLHRAARSGHAAAQFELGNAYAAGKGVRADQRTAYAWLAVAEANGEQRAADALRQVAENMSRPEVGEARFKVGDMYARGVGVRRDSVAAYSWYALAEQAGNASAKRTTAGLAGHMLPSDVAAGRSRAADWLQAHGGGK